MTDDASAKPTPPRATAANARKVTAILALMSSVVPLSLYAYDVERNVHARRVLEKACREVREETDARLSPDLVRTLFEGDAPVVLAALHESVERPCSEARERLSFWQWNILRPYALPRDPAQVARLTAALDRAKARCPQLMAQAFAEMPGHVDPARSAAAAAEACAPLDEGARKLSFIPEERYNAWQWASRMAAVAESLRQPERAAHAGPSPAPR